MPEIAILYRSARLVAVAKPPGLNVHEAPGPGGSVLRKLSAQGLSDLTPVHRLDKDASGVLLLARSPAEAAVVQRRWDEMVKTYCVLCEGIPSAQKGVIDAPILEHQTGKPERLRRALDYFARQNPGREIPPIPPPKTSGVHPAGRASQTDYALLEAFGERWAWLEVRPRQGRMHQIRVHLTHAGCPLAVDPLYGRRTVLTEGEISGGQPSGEILLARLPLHAAALRLPPGIEGKDALEIKAPLPEDLGNILTRLRAQFGST